MVKSYLYMIFLVLMILGGMYVLDVNSATWDPLNRELSKIDRFIQSNEVNGVTLDSRPLTPHSENIRLSVVPQLLAYYELYKKDHNPRYYQDIVDRANFLIMHFDELYRGDAFDGMTGYALLAAFEITNNETYFLKGEDIVELCASLNGQQIALNWGLMCGMAISKYIEVYGDPSAIFQLRRIIDYQAQYQHPDGSFPHDCLGSKDVHYTAWMSMELIKIKEGFPYKRIDEYLDGAYKFLKGRVNNRGETEYEENLCPSSESPECIAYYYSRASGCPQDYDTRGWVNELGYNLLVFDYFNDREYYNVAGFLIGLSRNGAYRDKWAYPHPSEDPVYLWSIGDPSVVRTSLVFWSFASIYEDR